MPNLNVIVVGASRGIGLGFVKHYLRLGHQVIATHRNNAPWLKELQKEYADNLSLKTLDVREKTAVKEFTGDIKNPIDVLILNAGVWLCPKGASPQDETIEQIRETMEVNTFAPYNIMLNLFPKLLNADSCVVYLSSTMASLADNSRGRYSSYRASKIAGNIFFQNWDIELAKAWIAKGQDLSARPVAFPISPGVVQTDMAGASKAPLTVEESVLGMTQVISSVRTHKKSGFYLYDGSLLQAFPEPAVVTASRASSEECTTSPALTV